MFFQGVPGSNPGISRPFIVGLVMLLLFLSMQVCSRLQLVVASSAPRELPVVVWLRATTLLALTHRCQL